MLSTDAQATLNDLRAHWQGEYYITCSDGIWTAKPFRAMTVVLTADSGGELRTKIQNDYARRRPSTSSGP